MTGTWLVCPPRSSTTTLDANLTTKGERGTEKGPHTPPSKLLSQRLLQSCSKGAIWKAKVLRQTPGQTFKKDES